MTSILILSTLWQQAIRKRKFLNARQQIGQRGGRLADTPELELSQLWATHLYP
jgi:hypothetical protein